jgi:hypothetical protein
MKTNNSSLQKNKKGPIEAYFDLNKNKKSNKNPEVFVLIQSGNRITR